MVLAHLSEINNTPQKALEAVCQALGETAENIRMHVACQDRCTDLLVL